MLSAVPPTMSQDALADLSEWTSDLDVPEVSGVHPFTTIYPPASAREDRELMRSVKRYGQLRPVVVMPNGLVLTGRRMLAVCQILNRDPMIARFVGRDGTASEADAWIYLGIDNQYRQLTTSQRAMAAARMRKFTQLTQKQRARLHGVSRESVQFADKVLASDDEDLISAVDGKTVKVYEGARRLRSAEAAAEARNLRRARQEQFRLRRQAEDARVRAVMAARREAAELADAGHRRDVEPLVGDLDALLGDAAVGSGRGPDVAADERQDGRRPRRHTYDEAIAFLADTDPHAWARVIVSLRDMWHRWQVAVADAEREVEDVEAPDGE